MAFWQSFWENFGQKLLFGSTLFLSLLLAFFGGIFYEKGQPKEQALVVRIPEYTSQKAEENTPPSAVQDAIPSQGLEAISKTENSSLDIPGSKDCQYVGSKNSDKFHLPTCAPAKRIKPENLRCFASQEAALAAGYVAGCLN